MATIPGPDALGARPIPTSSGGVVPLATGEGVQRAQQAIGQSVTQLGGVIQERMVRENARAAALEFKKKRDDWMLANVYSPETGLQARRGKDAGGVTKELLTKFQEDSQEWTKGLPPLAQEAADAWLESGSAELARTAAAHESRERQSWLDDVAASTVTSATSMASVAATSEMNPAVRAQKIEEQLGSASDVIGDLGRRHHWSEDQINTKQAEVTADIHASVLNTLLANHATYPQAIEYFDQHQDELGSKHAALLQDVTTAKDKIAITDNFTRILTSVGAGDAGRAEARKIENPVVQDGVLAKLSAERAAELQEKSDRQNMIRETTEGALDALPPGATFDDLPPHVQRQIGEIPGYREKVQAETKRRLAGTAREDNPEIREKYALLISDDPKKALEELPGVQFDLSDRTYKQLLDDARKAYETPEKRLEVRSQESQLASAYTTMSLKTARAKNDFRDVFYNAVDQFKAKNKRLPDETERAAIIRTLMLPFIRKGTIVDFYVDEPRRAWRVSEEERGIGKFVVPDESRPALLELLRGRGVNVAPKTPEDADALEAMLRKLYLAQAQDKR